MLDIEKKGYLVAGKQIKINASTVKYDGIINRFRVSEKERLQFIDKCEKADITTTQAFRGFMRAVNRGVFVLTPVGIKKV